MRAGVEVPGVARGEAGAGFLVTAQLAAAAAGKRGDAHARALYLDEMDVLVVGAHLHALAAGPAARDDRRRVVLDRLVDEQQLAARGVAVQLREVALAVAVAALADQL